MKQRKKLWNYSIIVVWAGLSIGWALKFSDFSTLGSLTRNDVVTVAAIVVFLIISAIACKHFMQITQVYNDFHAAVEKMRGNTQWQPAELEECFYDKKSRQNFQNYRAECERLHRNMPTGCECDIGDYFNEAAFEDYLSIDALNQYSGLYTGIGMLGTFIGLSLGLANFNFLGSSIEIAQNIESLMSCIQLAFITSIMGLGLSFTFSAQYRKLTRDTFEGLGEFVSEYHQQTYNANHSGLNKIIANQSGQTEAIQMLSGEIARNVSDILSDQISRMETTYLEACNLLEEAQIKGMEVLVDKFTEKLLGTLTSGIESLSQAIKETCEYQETATERIKENVEAIISLTDKSEEIQRISQDTVVKLKEYTDSLDQNMSMMMEQVQENNKSMLTASGIFERMAICTEQAVDATSKLREFAEKMVDATDELDDAVDQIKETYANHIEELGKTTGNMSAVADRIETVYEGQIEKFRELSESMIAGFDKQRTEFCLEAKQQQEELQKSGSEVAAIIAASVDAYKAETDRMGAGIADSLGRAILELRDSSDSVSKKLKAELDDHAKLLKLSSETVRYAAEHMDRSAEKLQRIVEDVERRNSEGNQISDEAAE